MKKQQDADIIKEREEEIASFLEELKLCKDPRSKQGRSYTLAEIILLVLCAQICGFESLREYEMYGKMKLELLKRFLPFRQGVPSKSTISRVLSLFEPEYLEALLVRWMERIIQSHTAQKQIAIDGKTHRGTRTSKEEKLHLVSAYGVDSGLVLAQKKVSAKSNEVTAIPVLLDALHLAGQIVSIDAMGCQQFIADKIREKKADYVLALKGNQGQLHEEVALYFSKTHHLTACKQYETLDKGHGRFERRCCYATDNVSWLVHRRKWRDLKTIVMVESCCIQQQKKTREIRYFISSLPADPAVLLRSVRAHWGIESLHWCLDVIFREDDRVLWNRNFARNESTIRKLALNLLKKFQGISEYSSGKAKVALKTLRKLLVGSNDSFEKLILGTA